MVLVVYLALGSGRLAQCKVHVRRSAVIETLGAGSILCVDKTGALTENSMKVAAQWADDAVWRNSQLELPSQFVRLLEIAMRACAI